jgi:hypothetical protein
MEFNNMTQKKRSGSVTVDASKRQAAPIICEIPKTRSAFTHLSAIMPITAGIMQEAIPSVRNTLPI